MGRPTISAVRMSVITVLLATHVAAGQDRALTPRQAWREALRVLVEEAADEKRAWPPRADFATRFPHSLEPAMVGAKLARRLHEQPAVDAYVRWQLTSFDPVLPRMDDRAFLRFVAALPSPPTNPMADDRFVRLVLRARETSPLSEADRERLRKEVDGVRARRGQAVSARRAASAFRAWVRDRQAEHPHRALLVRLSGLEAWAKAGWDVREIRSGLDTAVDAAAPLAAFEDTARRDFVRRAASLAGAGPMRIDRVRIGDDGRVDVTLGDSTVYDMDAARWARRLGITP